MATRRSSGSSVVDAVDAIFSALEPLDEETRERVVASALSLLGMAPQAAAQAPTRTAMSVPPEPRRAERLLSPVELMQEKSPASIPQKIALFAYYRERYEGKGRFSRSDLKSYFSKAKESPPSNYDRDFIAVVKQGWIHEDGSESYLTSKGLEAVEAGFSGKAIPRGRYVKKRKTKKKKTAKKKKVGKKARKKRASRN